MNAELAAGLLVLVVGSIGLGVLCAFLMVRVGIVLASVVCVLGVVALTVVTSLMLLAGTT